MNMPLRRRKISKPETRKLRGGTQLLYFLKEKTRAKHESIAGFNLFIFLQIEEEQKFKLANFLPKFGKKFAIAKTSCRLN